MERRLAISRKRYDGPGAGEAAEGPLLDLPLGNEPPALDPPLRESETGTATTRGEPAGRRPARRRGGSLLWLIPLLAFPIGLLAGYFFYSGSPVVAVEAAMLDFGEVRVATTSEELPLRVANEGERVLWISATTLAGDGAARFQIADDGCSGLELGTLEDCVVRLTFTPDSRGPGQAELRLESNDPNGPVTVTLNGLGVAPELAVTPRVLELGSQTVGRAGGSGQLRLANSGTAPLVLRSIGLVGSAAADFLRVADECSGRRLPPGGRCSLRFTFVPRAGGQRRAVVRIEHDALDEPAEVTLTAQGIRRKPILELDPTVVEFGAYPLGEASEVRRVRVANSGNDALRVRGVGLDTRHDVGGEAFEVVSETCTAAPVPAGGECAIEVRFESIAETAAQAVLAIDSSASSERDEVLLTGTGSAAHVLIEPLQLRFGQVGVGSRSAVVGALVRSSGTAALEVSEISLTGADAASFAVGGCSGAVLAPGEECAIEARFEPRRAGPHRAELVVAHNADARRHRLPLNGLGVEARLVIEPSAIDFGEVPVGASKRRLLTLANSGRAELTVRRLRLTGSRSAGFALEEDRCSGAVLRPSATCRVTVRFRPTSPGTRNIRLAVEHSASSGKAEELSIQAVAIP